MSSTTKTETIDRDPSQDFVSVRKVAINTCYGGFSLSPKAIKRLAELNGVECYFFTGLMDALVPSSMEDCTDELFWNAYTVPNPIEVAGSQDGFAGWSLEDRQKSNAKWDKITLTERPSERDDEKLIQVIEELGENANGYCARLKIVEIPTDIEWEIEEYDGSEWVAEKHQTWH